MKNIIMKMSTRNAARILLSNPSEVGDYAVFRKTCPKQAGPYRVYLCLKDRRKNKHFICGYFDTTSVREMTAEEMYQSGLAGNAPLQSIMEYTQGKNVFAWVPEKTVKLNKPVLLKNPPLNWQYVPVNNQKVQSLQGETSGKNERSEANSANKSDS